MSIDNILNKVKEKQDSNNRVKRPSNKLKKTDLKDGVFNCSDGYMYRMDGGTLEKYCARRGWIKPEHADAYYEKIFFTRIRI